MEDEPVVDSMLQWTPYEGNYCEPKYEQPPQPDGRSVNYDLMGDENLDEIRASVRAAYEAQQSAERTREKAKVFRRIDVIYRDIAAYVDILETLDWPNGRLFMVIPDEIPPESASAADLTEEVLWPLTGNIYNHNESPRIAIGPDRRLYLGWMKNLDHDAMTYSDIYYAPFNLYDEEAWVGIDLIETSLANLPLPTEIDLEIAAESSFSRDGTLLDPRMNLSAVRTGALNAYESTRKSSA